MDTLFFFFTLDLEFDHLFSNNFTKCEVYIIVQLVMEKFPKSGCKPLETLVDVQESVLDQRMRAKKVCDIKLNATETQRPGSVAVKVLND